MTCLTNCKTCEHKQRPHDGGWCYMFRNEPDGECGCWEPVVRHRPSFEFRTDSEPESDWADSKTGLLEVWKNPLFTLQKRLQVADGAVHFSNQVIENLRRQISDLKAERDEAVALSTERLTKLVVAEDALAAYAKPANWTDDDNGVDRIWLEPDSTTRAQYNGFELAAKALKAIQ